MDIKHHKIKTNSKMADQLKLSAISMFESHEERIKNTSEYLKSSKKNNRSIARDEITKNGGHIVYGDTTIFIYELNGKIMKKKFA